MMSVEQYRTAASAHRFTATDWERVSNHALSKGVQEMCAQHAAEEKALAGDAERMAMKLELAERQKKDA